MVFFVFLGYNLSNLIANKTKMKKAFIWIAAIVIVWFVFIAVSSFADCEGHNYPMQAEVSYGLYLLSAFWGIGGLVLFLAIAIFFPFSKDQDRAKLKVLLFIFALSIISGLFLFIITGVMTHLSCAPSQF